MTVIASSVNTRELFYEDFADQFDTRMNMYDTRKRIDLVFNKLLTEDLKEKTLLDAGCGTGWFSQAAANRKAVVSSMDLGERLLSKVREKCNATTVVGSVLEIPFPDNHFDFVVSSEVIEHTPDPRRAIAEMARVLKPGGKMVITTPNRLWYFSLAIANAFHLRPYQGLENWISWNDFVKTHQELNLRIEAKAGVHLFPFVVSFLNPGLSLFDRFHKSLYRLMVNIAIKSIKPIAEE